MNQLPKTSFWKRVSLKLVSKHLSQMTPLFNYKSFHSKFFFLLNTLKINFNMQNVLKEIQALI